MQTSTLVMMIVVLGIVWGGFLALLVHSMRAEKKRQAGGSLGAPPASVDGDSG